MAKHLGCKIVIINPLRHFRRRKRLMAEAEEEVLYLRRRFGAEAHAAALGKLSRSDLTRWGRQVITEAARRLKAG